MAVDSLNKLKTSFASWRAKKMHVREQVPEKLMERARRVAAVHGTWAVSQAIKIEHCRLARPIGTGAKNGGQSGRRSVSRGRSGAVDDTRPKRAPAHRAKKVALAAPCAKRATTPVPSYSRIAFPGPETMSRPLVEVETSLGVKLRVFAITPETVSLLSALSGPGRAS